MSLESFREPPTDSKERDTALSRNNYNLDSASATLHTRESTQHNSHLLPTLGAITQGWQLPGDQIPPPHCGLGHGAAAKLAKPSTRAWGGWTRAAAVSLLQERSARATCYLLLSSTPG